MKRKIHFGFSTALLAITMVASFAAPLAAQSIKTDGEIEALGFAGDGSKLTNLRLDGFDAACLLRTLEGRIFTEVEPNDTAVTATPYCLGVGSGRVGGVQEDWWSSPAAAGDLVFAWADTTFSPFTLAPIQDSFLDLFANDGVTLIESDDDDGTPFLSAVIAGAAVPQSGRVFTRVRELNGRNITYRLYQVVASPADVQAESEPNDTPGTADVLDTQKIVTGFQPTSALLTTDWYQFFAPSLTRINVILDEDPDRDGLPTAVTIALFFPDGVTVMGPGSLGGVGGDPPDGEAYGAVTLGAGNYFVAISNTAGGTDTDGDYRFVVQILPNEG